MACEDRRGSVVDAGAGDLGDRPDFLERLGSVADYALVQGEGGEVKFLGRVDGREPPAPVLDRACLFQNTELFPGHVTFLRSLPEVGDVDFATYMTMVFKRSSRVLWGGSLKYYTGEPHPRTGARGILAYFLYADPNDVDALTVDEIVELDARLKTCVPYARELLVLVGMDVDQATRFEAQRASLTARGVSLVDLRKLRQGVGAEGYVLGEGYGYLKVVPPGGDVSGVPYGPRDVLVTPSCPQDLSLVAGLVTTTPQNVHSHVNLRLGAKGVPSGFAPDIQANSVVMQLEGRLVHIVVEASTIKIDPAPLATAQAFWEARRPALPPPVADLAVTELRGFGPLQAGDATAYGTKAANLGELYEVLPSTNRVTGFAVPFSAYRDFMGAAGLQASVDALLADPRTATEAAYRDAQLAALVSRIEGATVPADLLGRLQVAARAGFGDGFATLPLRLRSSSNVEDGQIVSGAGIHDSARGCFADDLDDDAAGPSACLSVEERQALAAQLAAREAELLAHPERTWLHAAIDDLRSDLTKERGFARALKKVYASLWSRRAFEERAYWGIDHRAVFMGVAVNPAFPMERLDAVAVTNLDPAASVDGGSAPLYRVVSQVGGESVVRPLDPSAVAETMLFERGADGSAVDIRLLTRSSLSTDPLWSPARTAELASLLFLVHDHFSAIHADMLRPSFDVELKITADDRVVIKQIRPYVPPFTP